MDSLSSSHIKWKCQYRIVFIPKYRRKVMYGNDKADIREVMKKLCEFKKVKSVVVNKLHCSYGGGFA